MGMTVWYSSVPIFTSPSGIILRVNTRQQILRMLYIALDNGRFDTGRRLRHVSELQLRAVFLNRGHQGVVRGDQAEATGRDLVDTLFRQVLGRVCSCRKYTVSAR